MTTLVRTYKDDIVKYQNNPTLVHAAALQLVRDSSNNTIDIVDCTNPFVALLETCAATVSAGLEKMEVLNRKQYAIAAQNIQDLYPHMSDKDYGDRFATPSTTKFFMILAMEEVINSLVLDPVTGLKRLQIPAHTNFTIADTVFSMQYPVNIIQRAYGGYSVLYDVSNPSPLQKLETNVVPWETRKDATRQDFMVIPVEVQQFSIISEQAAINSAQELKMNVEFNEQYYYARVWHGSAETGWTELTVTHTAQIYDVTDPTAVLQLLDSSLYVRIPQIYVNKGLLTEKIRVDVYQTKGPLALNLSDYPTNAAVTQFLVLDKSEDNTFVAPFRAMRQFQAFSPFTTSGGTNALSFDELRLRVINNTLAIGDRVITNVELPTALATKGYELVANYDLLTNRVFLATRTMPAPSNPKLITAASASIETLATTINAMLNYNGVRDNGSSITITPDLIYQNIGGTITPVADSTIASILAMVPEQRALIVSNGGYYYTPFHYVLDMSSSEFDLRAYYLDSPVITSKSFDDENDLTLLAVASEAYVITRTPNGYAISISIVSSGEFKAIPDADVYVQLAFIPYGEKDYAYINGVLTNMTDAGERVYTFDLSTNYNVDAHDQLQLTKFTMYDTEPRLTGAGLTTKFKIMYSVDKVMGPQWKPGQLDRNLGSHLLPTHIVAVTQEELTVQFGQTLDTLWSSARTVAGSAGYQTWDIDIAMTYTDDVYERDETGSAVRIVGGVPIINKLHAKGDPVRDPDTNLVVMKHKKGDVMFDSDGAPIPAPSNGLERQVDLLLIEGAYWFATDATSASYRQELTSTVVGWLTKDLESLSKRLLENTRLYYYPKVNTGYVDCMLADGTVLSLQASQAFRVDYVVSEAVFGDAKLKAQLTAKTIAQISAELKNQTVSEDQISYDLRDLCGDDVISNQVSGLGGESNYPLLSVVDPANRLSLKKRLVAQTDNTLIVEEDITINWIPHVPRA